MKRRNILIGSIGLSVAGLPTVAGASERRLHVTWPGESHMAPLKSVHMGIDRRFADARCVDAAVEWIEDFMQSERPRGWREPVALVLHGRRYAFHWRTDNSFTYSAPRDCRGVRAIAFDARPRKTPPLSWVSGCSWYPTGEGEPMRSGLHIDPHDWLPQVEVDGKVVHKGTWPEVRDQ